MDGGGAPKAGIKISFVVLGVCVLVCLICYFYGSWSDAKAEEQLTPKLAIDEMMKAARQYQKQTGQFPNDLSELEGKVWHHKPVPDFGPDKRRWGVLHYYYIYQRVNPLTCSIWAIPSGPKREGSTTVFLSAGVDWYRVWKGPSLSKADIEKLPLVPTIDQLNVMGMTEQPQPGNQGGSSSPVTVSTKK